MGSEPADPSRGSRQEGAAMPPSFAPRSPHTSAHRPTSARRSAGGPSSQDGTSPGAQTRTGSGGEVPAGTSTPGSGEAGDGAPSRRSGRRPRLSRRAQASVGVVTLASGLLFSLSAASAREESLPRDAGLVGLVRHQQDTVDEMMSGNNELQARIDDLVARSAASPSPSPTSVLQLSRAAVSGPGITVTLTDAPAGPLPENAKPDDLVIHQQDIEDVMNALWRGGAEAMTVQGKRVHSRSVIRCIGNVILVDGARFSPPYVIAAIGDPQSLEAALDSDARITIFLQYVARYQLGWDVDTGDDLHFDPVAQDPGIRFAQVEDHG